MINRQEEIRSKGFRMNDRAVVDYSKMKIGLKTVEDAVLNLSSTKKRSGSNVNKETIDRALASKDLETLRNISTEFYNSNGMYQRLCNYLAQIYRYDWYVVPYIISESDSNKALKQFTNVLNFLDNSKVKEFCSTVASAVVKEGCYYGYKIQNANKIIIQDLPTSYCRSRYSVLGKPAIEFNMKFFDDNFTDIQYRMRILKMFPKEFSAGYVLYKKGKLKPDFTGDKNGWYLLDLESAFKFSINNDIPPLISSIEPILDLEEAQELDKKKMMQQLLKIVIQKLPMDKNGELLFDLDEAQDIHNNAVLMLKRAIGIDVLTTFADIEVADMSDKNTTTTSDELKKVERTVYNAAGVSQNLFNASGNLSLDKSIANDEASMKVLVLQLQNFLNDCIASFSNKKYKFSVRILETTVYNYKEIAKMYKEQVQIGYSKMLPQIAMGHSQSEIIATANFENNILNLSKIMVPPMMSSTMSSKVIEQKENGRPELPDEQKSDKTILNKESK